MAHQQSCNVGSLYLVIAKKVCNAAAIFVMSRLHKPLSKSYLQWYLQMKISDIKIFAKNLKTTQIYL